MLVHFLVPASCRLIVTLSPFVVKGVPPAWAIMLVVKPASPESAVM
ncbi:Uncharacterised protein [Mycobacteroides abscessus subsp. abscessus]|nr:Uncharacterised protein [Mycobacteroides abscessus subsp. abscessus]